MVMMFCVGVPDLSKHDMSNPEGDSARRAPSAIVEVHATYMAMVIEATNNTAQVPSVFSPPKSSINRTAVMNVTEIKDTAVRKKRVEQIFISK